MFGLLLLFIATPIILVVAIFVKLSHLRSDVDSLKKKLNSGYSQSPEAAQEIPAPNVTDPYSGEEMVPIPGVVTRREEVKEPEEEHTDPLQVFGAWLKEDWLMKLGGFLIVIAFAFFASYAVINDWIGPVGRITVILLFGIASMAGGALRIKKHTHQGGIFMVLGSIIISLGVLAARAYYDMFTPVTGLGIIFLSMVFLAVTSVVRRSKALAFSSLVLAGITPFMLDATFTFTFLFSYLFVIIIGLLWVVAVTGFSELTLAGLVLVIFYSLGYITGPIGDDQTMMILFSYIFAAIFFVVNIAGILKRKDEEGNLDFLIGIGNSALLMGWIMSVVSAEWQSLIIAMWAAIFLVASFIIHRETKRLAPFYLYGVISVIMIATATAIQLDGAALTIAFIIETVAIILGSYLVTKKIEVSQRASFLMFGPILLGLDSLGSSAWRDSVLHEDFFVALIVGLTSILVGVLLHMLREEKDEPSVMSGILIVIGTLYFYAMIWLSTHAVLVNDDVAVTISLFTYTAIGLGTYIYGRVRDVPAVGKYGGIMLAFVVLRLVMVDVWDMELAQRIFTFFVVGILLIGTAFIKKEKKADTNQTNQNETLN
jgi:hypothetical protein